MLSSLHKRLLVAAVTMIPAWAIVTVLLLVWSPLIRGQPAWIEAAVIAPQVVLTMAFVVNPLVAIFFSRIVKVKLFLGNDDDRQ